MTYCVKCKRVTGFRTKPNVVQTKNKRLMLKGNCDVCGRIKTQFVKRGSGLLSSLGIKIPGLSKIPILGDLIF